MHLSSGNVRSQRKRACESRVSLVASATLRCGGIESPYTAIGWRRAGLFSIARERGSLRWQEKALGGQGGGVALSAPDSNLRSLRDRLRSFNPDWLALSGWMYTSVRRLVAEERRRGRFTICLWDTPLKASATQFVRAKIGGSILRRSFDVAWTAGPGAEDLARVSGFPGGRIWQGVYTVDDASSQ